MHDEGVQDSLGNLLSLEPGKCAVGIGSEAAWSLDVGPSGYASKGLRADKSALGRGGLLSSGCRGNCLPPTTCLAITAT